MEQNPFKGNYTRTNNSLKVFRHDLIYGECSTETMPGGYLFTIHADKRQLFSIQYVHGYLIGVGNPFSNQEYAEYLIGEFPREVIDKIQKRFEEHKFSTDNPLMFGLNNTSRVIKCKDGGLYVCFPDNSCVIYDNGEVAEEIALGDAQRHSNKIGNWLRNQLAYIHKGEEHWKKVIQWW